MLPILVRTTRLEYRQDMVRSAPLCTGAALPDLKFSLGAGIRELSRSLMKARAAQAISHAAATEAASETISRRRKAYLEVACA